MKRIIKLCLLAAFFSPTLAYCLRKLKYSTRYIKKQRRISDNWLLKMDAKFLFDQSPSDPAFAFSRDDYLEMFLTYNF